MNFLRQWSFAFVFHHHHLFATWMITKDIKNTQKPARRPPKETPRLITEATLEVSVPITSKSLFSHLILFLACTWRHYFLKSKTKEPSKFLSSSGKSGGRFISVNNFSEVFSSVACFVWKPAHFEFQSYGGAWTRLWKILTSLVSFNLGHHSKKRHDAPPVTILHVGANGLLFTVYITRQNGAP